MTMRCKQLGVLVIAMALLAAPSLVGCGGSGVEVEAGDESAAIATAALFKSGFSNKTCGAKGPQCNEKGAFCCDNVCCVTGYIACCQSPFDGGGGFCSEDGYCPWGKLEKKSAVYAATKPLR